MSISHARMLEIERTLTGVARKVFQHVPAQEAWRAQEIYSDMMRTGANIDRRVLDGCLSSLKESGLVRESEPGCFIRIEARPPRTVEVPSINNIVAPAAAPEVRRDPLDELAECAASVRELSRAAALLAERIESVAIRAAEDAQRVAVDGQKLQQLRDLLKGLA